MSNSVIFDLDPEVQKPFLSGAFIEVEDDGTIAIGVAHRDGSGYAYARITKRRFQGALITLGLDED